MCVCVYIAAQTHTCVNKPSGDISEFVCCCTSMSQEQPRRGAEDEQEPIKYGEVFVNVKGSELGSKPITPRDAAIMQSAEAQVQGATQKGGPAALMESAAAINERAGLVSHDAVTNLARNEGVTISATNEGRGRVITETLGGQVQT